MIKVESITRPDLMRYASTQPPTTDEWWEWSPLFHAGNAGKRAITLDLTRPEGIAVFERLLGTADVLIENYTPRVMDQFGFGWDRVHEINPDLVMTRMPAFGLDGPWRDNTGFAQTMECISGMAWLTGFADGPPVLVRGACDPLAGMHAVIATLLALLDRDANGGGRLVEATMVEAALNAAAEQVLEYSATGTVLTRDGNRRRRRAARRVPRARARTSGSRSRSRPTSSGSALRQVLGDPAWATSDSTRTTAGRPRTTRSMSTFERGRRTAARGRRTRCAPPACPPRRSSRPATSCTTRSFGIGIVRDEPHRVTGEHECQALPFRFARSTRGCNVRATLGQHNDEVLSELGLDADEIDALRHAVLSAPPAGL